MNFNIRVDFRCICLIATVISAFGCASEPVQLPRQAHTPAPAAVRPVETAKTEPTVPAHTGPGDRGVTVRPITDEELWRISEQDPDLSPVLCRQILARLNIRASYHISEEISAGRPLKVPNDFSAYKDWSPLPAYVPQVSGFEKSILVVKGIFFLGWYEKGHRVGDTHICLGNSEEPTEPGSYRVLEKDAAHVSRSYKNDFGQPAWMPWSMKIYGTVYIHAGDITGEFCSHGCVTLPMKAAEDLFHWTDAGTPVIIVESMRDLGKQGFKAQNAGGLQPPGGDHDT